MPIPIRDILHVLKDANSNLADETSLSGFAARSGWSKFHFLREFHRITGETPKQYFQRVRLERAAAALNTSRKPVIDIALEAGFRSHEVFIRAFSKHFGCAPSKYRKASLLAELPASNEYESLVHEIGPCIALFHIEQNSNKRVEKMVRKLELSKVTLEQNPMLYIRRKLERSQLQQSMGECFGKLFGHGMQLGLPITGQPIARYVSFGPGLWTVDFVLPLAAPAAGTEEIEPGFLEGGLVLLAKHWGPYEALHDSYVEIEAWMEREGVSPRAGNWEQYVTSPGHEPDPTKWQTDIFWPIK